MGERLGEASTGETLAPPAAGDPQPAAEPEDREIPTERTPLDDTEAQDEVATDPVVEEERAPREPESSDMPEAEVEEAAPCVSFEEAVLPVIEAECAGCHSAVLSMGSLDLSAPAAYFNLVEGSSAVTGQPFVVPGSPDESYLMVKFGATPPAGVKMPPEPSSLTPEEIASVSAWISGGANLSCEPVAPEPPAVEGPVYELEVNLTNDESLSGNLRVSLFASYPSSEPAQVIETVDGAVFPLTLTVAGVPEGAYIAEAVLDRMPFNAASVGPEDRLAIAALTIPDVMSLSLTLGAAPEGDASDSVGGCQECAPGLVCGADPAFPNYCAGGPGSCGEIDGAGVCLSDTLVAYCVGEGASAHLLSLDCTTNPKATVCGEAGPGTFDCVVPTEAPIVEPEPESSPCGTCASGLACGQDPALPEALCTGEPGACEGLDYAGTCVSGDVLLYCSDDTGAGTPLSFDCTLNEELTSCGETTPGVYDCVLPGSAPPPEPEVDEDPVTAFELFAQVHPVLEASCSGWLCHQYSGFAQPDLEGAYAVVQDKNFADNILDAIVEGRMPAGNFGLPLCTGDPSVDTDPKCLTQAEIDLVTQWVALENGEALPPLTDDAPTDDAPSDDVPSEPGVQVTFTEVHPILNEGCGGLFCHSGGFAGNDIQAAFATVEDKGLCEPILEAVQNGSMPPGKGCTGDPIQDANISGCLGPEEHALLVEWVLGSDSPCSGPQ